MLAFASGTRVAVRDLFGSMPVRVKQRAIEVERVGTSRDFEHLLFNIVALLLPWPGEVTVSVQDSYARRTVTLQASQTVDWSQSYRSTAPVVLSRTTMLLAQASLVEKEDLKSWVPIGATASGVSVRGCVSLQPVATKRVQFIAVGIQPLLNEHQSNLFYEDVNRVFEDSSFGVVEEATLDNDGRPAKTQGFTGKELKPKRSIDRWPMFFLQITLSSGADSVDIEQFLDDRHQNVAVITDLLQVMAYEFLKKHHFRPRSITAIERLKKQKSNTLSPTPQPPSAPSSGPLKPQTKREVKTPRSGPQSRRRTSSPHSTRHSAERRASPFTSWSTKKSSMPQSTREKGSAVSNPPSQQTFGGPTSEQHASPARTENPLFDRSGVLLRKPFDDVDEGEATPKADVPGNHPPGTGSSSEVGSARETVVWVDPNTKIKSLIDPRTGFAVKHRNSPGNKLLPRPSKHQAPRDVRRIPEWKPAAVGEQNTVFQATEPRIAQILQESEIACCGHGGVNREVQDLGDFAADAGNGNMLATLEGRISKRSLQKAEIVAQVDQKFILTKVVTNTPSDHISARNQGTEPDRLLILIDQHAADERCRVETLLRAYFVPDPAGTSHLTAQTQSLDKPLLFDLSKQDGELLIRFQGHFAHWGVVYEVFRGDDALPQKGVTVEVQLLPPSILERCRLEPRLLVDLLRKEIWKLHGTGSRGSGRLLRAGTDNDWVARFHDCPEGILEMINSRACRSKCLARWIQQGLTDDDQARSCLTTP